MELREFAQRVLMGTTLKDKLNLNPKLVTDCKPGKKIKLPNQPGRPDHLIMAPRERRANFPGVKQLERSEERGKMLHFLANHELLATELMALVLLRFPQAPKEFRMGVYKTLRDEQAHTLMYIRRMKECGIEFGSLPLNDYFWKMVSPMEQPIDFVTRLSLTFEQANLDFSCHYAKLFRQVGDHPTAKVLEHIYSDEIEHVGHGLKWFKQWKDKEKNDWDAFKTYLSFPLVPSKAKGVAPFNRQGRVDAGIDKDFIDELEFVEGSRGRTPNIHLFNGNSEAYAMSDATTSQYTPKKSELALDHDFEILPLAWARRDDIVYVRNKPRLSHLSYLGRSGLQLPEWVEYGDKLEGRKIGGMKPWAWTSDASQLLKPFASITTKKASYRWREALDSTVFSKEKGRSLLAMVQPEEVSMHCRSIPQIEEFIKSQSGDILMKSPFSSAGRNHKKLIQNQGWTESILGWAKNVLRKQGYLIVEPYLNRVLDFSSQYEMNSEGEVKHIGMTRLINDKAGRYLGSLLHTKWLSGVDEDLSQWLFRDVQVMQVYKYQMPKVLKKVLGKFAPLSAFGVDAFVYKDCSGNYRLRKIVELNTRYTMGRVGLELLHKNRAQAGFLQILRKSKMRIPLQQWLSEVNRDIINPTARLGSIILNDPVCAQEFYAVWHARKTYKDIAKLVNQSP